jgi:hypothetical protein
MLVPGGLSARTLHVWTTNLNSAKSSDDFVRQPDLAPVGGGYSLTLQPGFIYSLTTTSGQGKGTVVSPTAHGLALPYQDDFESYALNTEARYVADMQGAFEVRPCLNGRSGKCLQQVAPVKPIEWQGDSDAFALVGDTAWANYKVSLDVSLQQSGIVKLVGRANTQKRPQSKQAGYELRVSETGAWTLAKRDDAGTLTTLDSGSVAALGLGGWHMLQLSFADNDITAGIDGASLTTVHDASFTAGQVGFGVVGYQTDQFDNLSVTPGPPPHTASGLITSGIAGKCLAAQNNGATNGTPVVIDDCDAGSPAQNWTMAPGNTAKINGLCVDVTAKATADGTLVELWACNGGANQRWTAGANTSLVGTGSGKCLDDPGHSTQSGTQVEIWTCNGGPNQEWTLPE